MRKDPQSAGSAAVPEAVRRASLRQAQGRLSPAAPRARRPRDSRQDAGATGPLSRSSILIGVISDTHGLLRPEAIAALRGSQYIIHAGDVGAPEILERLSAIAPVTAVRGNIDEDAWARRLPETQVLEAGGVSIYVLHDLMQLDLKPEAARFDVVISGHSHIPKQEMRNGVLYFNPGSAGPRRLKLPVTLGRLIVKGGKVRSERVTLLSAGH